MGNSLSSTLDTKTRKRVRAMVETRVETCLVGLLWMGFPVHGKMARKVSLVCQKFLSLCRNVFDIKFPRTSLKLTRVGVTFPWVYL
jgi:hypothetical protein